MNEAIARVEDSHVVASSESSKELKMESGIEYARLRAWADSYAQAHVRITLERCEERKLGSARFPVTAIGIAGAPAEVDAAFNDFYLRFMSAGA